MPKKSILIIDDESEFLKIMKVWLESLGYTVITAQDGKSGLGKARESNPDMIILDVLMPEMNGYEVCRLLKFDEKYKSIPVIMLTAKTQNVDRQLGERVGADDYISKPFKNEELLAKIKNILKQ